MINNLRESSEARSVASETRSRTDQPRPCRHDPPSKARFTDDRRRHTHRRAGPPRRARRLHTVAAAAANAARPANGSMGTDDFAPNRRHFLAVSVAQLRDQADDLARQPRELDT